MKKVIRTERGWGGHFICADRCMFRRNTLLDAGDTKIVVSTVGNFWAGGESEQIGHNRYYETMAFHSKAGDEKYHDADVEREVHFESDWAIGEDDRDNEANDMHEQVVREIFGKLVMGIIRND